MLIGEFSYANYIKLDSFFSFLAVSVARRLVSGYKKDEWHLWTYAHVQRAEAAWDGKAHLSSTVTKQCFSIVFYTFVESWERREREYSIEY